MEHCPRLLAAALKGGCVDTCIILSHLAASLSPCLQGPGEGGKVLGWRPCAVMALIRMGIMPVIGEDCSLAVAPAAEAGLRAGMSGQGALWDVLKGACEH